MPEQITKKRLAEWASAGLVLLSGAMAGHYAALGMNLVQWAGAVAAVLGSVTVAVAVRIWPGPRKAEAKTRD
ncbi:hypothetical protein [Phenylobacterium sp.]|uniref:hypothetical protein n=1 Tax=Phenylobacterium sp. TaxID=1871053 RepID=UPI00391C0388